MSKCCMQWEISPGGFLTCCPDCSEINELREMALKKAGRFAPKPSIVDEREKTHGPFEKTARRFSEIVDALSDDQGPDYSDVQACALSMIAMKLARIASGNPREPDHWRDISGYAELVVRSLEGKK